MNYAKHDSDFNRHHERHVRFIESMAHKIVCLFCHGAGGWIEPVLEDGSGPYYNCGWCEGTGFMTPYVWSKYMYHAYPVAAHKTLRDTRC